MKKTAAIFILAVLLLATLVAAEMSASEAKAAWHETKKHSQEMQEQHRDAKLMKAKGHGGPEDVIDTGKASLHAALEEAEAWLVWKKLEARENPEVPEHILSAIENDVESNIETIDALRTDVNAVENELQLGLTWLKMVGKYFELVTDVARNSGNMWIFIANEKADTVEEYEAELREIAEDMSDNEDIFDVLDDAERELEMARRNIDNAEDVYDQVKIPGTPVLKFAEGNNYLRAARANLMLAHRHLNQAYRLIV